MRSFSLFPAGRSSRSAAFWRTRLHGRPSSPRTSNRSQTATGATADEKERSLRGPTSGKQVVPCAGRADEEENRETCFGCVPLPLACFLHSLALFFGSLLSPVLQGVAFLLWLASTGGAGGAGAVPSGTKTAVDLPDGSGNSRLSSAAQALSLFIGSVGFLANEFVDAPALGVGVVASKGENAPEVSRAPRAFLQHPSTALPGVPKRVGPAGRAAQIAIDDHRTAEIATAHRPGEGGAAAHFFCANLVSCLFSAVSCASGGLGIYANQQTPYLLFFVSLFLYHWPAKAWSLATTLLQAGETERGRDEQSVLNRSPPADSNSVQATTLHLAGAASFPTLSSALSWDRVQIGFVLADFVLATYLLLVHHRFLCGHVETSSATEHCVETPVEEAHCSTSCSRDDEQEDDHEVRFFTHPELDSSSSSAADIRAYVDEQRFFGFDSALPYARPHGGGDCTSEDETASFLYDLSRLGDLSIPEIAPVFEETPEDLLGDEEGAEEHLRSLERSLSSLFREGEETAWE